jgi:hypothetical protein
MLSGFTPEYFAPARASVRRIRPLTACSSGMSTAPADLVLRNCRIRSAIPLAPASEIGVPTPNALQNSSTKSTCRSADSSQTAMLPLVW